MASDWVPEKEKFKNVNGQLYTRRLFLEESYTINDKSNTIYTLKDVDHPDGYKSLYRLYMDMADPTEFAFGEKYLFSYDHWKFICEAHWFKDHIARWRKELELSIKHQALEQVKIIAASPNHKNSMEAIKILLNAGWKTPSENRGKGRGRPSKEEIAGTLKEVADEQVLQKEEAQRILNYEN